MRSLNVWCAVSCALVLLAGCGNENGASTSSTASTSGTPAQSATVLSSSSSSSESASGTATVTWVAPTANTDGTGLTNLAGYNVYYGTNPSSLTQSVQVASAGTTSAELSNLAAGTWYFAVTAYTNTGIESGRSSVVSKTIT